MPGYDTKKLTSKPGQEQSVCDCLPDCENVEYTAESSSAILNRRYSTNQKNL